VLWRFLQRLVERRPPLEVDEAIRTLLARTSTPPMLPPDALDGIPDTPGVYLFYGLNAHPIYIGKSLALRTRVMAHFSADHANAQDAKLTQEVCRIDWEETAGEVSALLREADLVKTRLPAHNIALRRRQNQMLLRLADGKPKFVPALKVALDALPEHHGPFSSRASARTQVVELAREHGLCLLTLGLERRSKATAEACADAPPAPCFAFQVKRCRGACVGEEAPAAHAARFADALAHARIDPWPFAGTIALIERRTDALREDIHVVDRWCWLGSVRTLDAAETLAATDAPRSFEPDVYRILRSALAKGAVDVLPLGLRAAAE